ncbi:MAG: diguanylate cyclase [Deltaproteobacteria bacterium]|nr:diguanylate cyclase [Deltaproteobacteria bacterium]
MYYPILLIHPSESFCDAVIRGLGERGYFVISASSEKQSIEAIDAGVYAVAILPARIGMTDGDALIARIRAIWAETHIVVLNDEVLNEVDYERICKAEGIDHICSAGYTSDEVSLIAARLAGSAPPMTRIPGGATSVPSASPYQMDNSFEMSIMPSSRGKFVEDPLQLEILALAREYQKTLPGELRNLRMLLSKARQGEDLEEMILEIRRITHTISGTSGTLGFNEISGIVHQINEKIKKVEQKGKGSDDEWQTLLYLIDRAISTPERSSLVPMGAAAAVDESTLLIIGEDRSHLTELYEIGKLNHVKVIPACTRVEAIAEINSGDVDGAIICLDMNNLDPVALVADIRALEGRENLQVAFMSKVDSVEQRVLAASAGATMFMEKPLTEEALVEVAREFATQRAQIDARVLIVDDDPYFRKHISNLLASEHLDVQDLEEPQRVLETLDMANPDILLLDVQMPGLSGFDVCRMVRSIPKWRNLPVLFLTGESDVQARIECFNVGGDDYIQKPVIKEELLARINVRLERIRMFRERADKDPLTRLLNRRAFLEQVTDRMNEGARFSRPLSLCIVDLDHFKHVNDTYGHLAGDRVLQAMGKLLLSRYRNTDVRGRWGGEEFAVAFYNEEASNARRLLFESLKALRKMEFTGDGGEKFRVTFSAGVATFPDNASRFDELFRIADECLYRAKENGRNQIQIVESDATDA